MGGHLFFTLSLKIREFFFFAIKNIFCIKISLSYRILKVFGSERRNGRIEKNIRNILGA